VLPLAARQGEAVVFQQIEDRDAPVLLDLGRGRRQRTVVDVDPAQPVRGLAHPCPPFKTASRAETARPCADSPSDSARRTAAGPIAASASGESLAMVLRLRKSITDRPEEKRAERAVGRTWFGPLT